MTTRRDFLKFAAVGGASLFAMTAIANAEEKRRAGKPADAAAAGGDSALPLVKPGEGMAAGVNYQDDKAKVKDAALKIDRQGVKFADQKCSNCALYQAAGKKDGAEVGKCSLFANQLVKANSWCGSWNKKA